MAERKSKTDLINAIATATGLPKNNTSEVIDAVFATIQDWVASGAEVAFVGFGTFSQSKRAPRTGRNPQTGEAINIPAATLPKFKAGKTFKEAVDKK